MNVWDYGLIILLMITSNIFLCVFKERWLEDRLDLVNMKIEYLTDLLRRICIHSDILADKGMKSHENIVIVEFESKYIDLINKIPQFTRKFKYKILDLNKIHPSEHGSLFFPDLTVQFRIKELLNIKE